MKNVLAIFSPAALHLFIPAGCRAPAARTPSLLPAPSSPTRRQCAHTGLKPRLPISPGSGRLRKKCPWGKEERQQRLKKSHKILLVFQSGQTLPHFKTCGEQLQSFNGITASAVFCKRTWAIGRMQVTNTDLKLSELLKPGGLQMNLLQTDLACGKTHTRACSLPVPTIHWAGIS